MSRYYHLILLILVSSVFVACSIKEPKTDSNYCCPKLFEDEDRLIMSALYLNQLGAYKQSAEIFSILYDKTKRVEYKIEEIKNYLILKDYEKAKKEVEKALKRYPNNARLLRISALVYFHLKDFEKSKEFILKAIKIENNPKDYEFLSSIFLIQKKYDLALKYLQSAYAINPEDKIVDQMATIMFLYLDKKRDAIAYLETHSRIYGCSKVVCHKLASFYASLNDIDGLLSVYKRLYKRFEEDRYGLKIVEIYIFKKDYNSAIKFLEESRLDDELLFELYKLKKEFKKAATLAYKLYLKTDNLNYLAQNAMFLFESTKRKDKDFINDIAKKLEKVIKKIKDPLYLNYLGYLYIDYDLNIDRGIKLVKEALKKNPDSPFYLDSLAWGYYKKGRCKEAYELMKKVVDKLGLKDEEVKLHLKKIEECLKKEGK